MKTKQFSLELSTDAEADFEHSYNYYLEESTTVANTFLYYINQSFEHIKERPGSYPLVHKTARKFVVKKFPFVIYYQLIEAKIQVLAIFHTSRNPTIWNERG